MNNREEQHSDLTANNNFSSLHDSLTIKALIHCYVKKHIYDLVQERVREGEAISSYEDFFLRIQAFHSFYIGGGKSYELFLEDFIDENIQLTSVNELEEDGIWRNSAWFYEFFKEKISPVIDDLVEYDHLEAFCPCLTEGNIENLTDWFIVDIFSQIKVIEDILFKIELEDYQDILEHLPNESDKNSFLLEKHKHHLDMLDENAKKYHFDITDYIDRGWVPAYWRLFTPSKIYMTLWATISNFRLRNLMTPVDFLLQLSQGSWVQYEVVEDFASNAAHYRMIKWIMDQSSPKQPSLVLAQGPTVSSEEVSKHKKKAIPVYKNFTEIFIDKSDENINNCINALRNIDPPVIGSANNWTGGGNKVVIVGWLLALGVEGKIEHVSKAVLCDLLAKYFLGLTIHPSTFSKAKDKASVYAIAFQKLIK